MRGAVTAAVAVLVAAAAAVAALATPAATQVPPAPPPVPTPTRLPLPTPVPLPTPLPIPTPVPLPTPLPIPLLPTEDPTPTASPDPTPTGTDEATPDPTPDRTAPPSGDVTDGGAVTRPGGGGGPSGSLLPGLSVVDAPPLPLVADPEAQLAPPPANGPPMPPTRRVSLTPLAAALPGAFAVGLLALFTGAGTMLGTHTLLRRGVLTAVDDQGGIDVEMTKRWRLLAGVVLLGAAAAVGIIGYLKISLEPQVPVQVVYLASAGFAVVVLAVAGGSMLVADQLRADEKRIGELERAVVVLGDLLRPGVQHPPRLDASDADTTEIAMP